MYRAERGLALELSRTVFWRRLEWPVMSHILDFWFSGQCKNYSS